MNCTIMNSGIISFKGTFISTKQNKIYSLQKQKGKKVLESSWEIQMVSQDRGR